MLVDVARLAAAGPVATLSGPVPSVDTDGTVAGEIVAVDLGTAAGCTSEELAAAAATMRATHAIVVGVADAPPPDVLAEAADVVLAATPHDRRCVAVADLDAALEELVAAAAGSPGAALSLAWLLRGQAGRSVIDGLIAESAAYSMLLAGPAFAEWLRRRAPAREAEPGDRVRVERDEERVRVTLTRAARRNAFDMAMRRALVDAFELAAVLPGMPVELSAEGPCFSAGGDLDEFGTAPDVVAAHVVRVVHSPAASLDRIRDRVTAYLHGACVGAGIEIPAYAGTVVAAPDATFRLPELSMGLIPGAGGTVSIPRRIGRQRTLWWALTGSWLDAPTALSWGLVDAVR